MLTSQFPHFTNQSKIPRLPPCAAQLYCSSCWMIRTMPSQTCTVKKCFLFTCIFPELWCQWKTLFLQSLGQLNSNAKICGGIEMFWRIFFGSQTLPLSCFFAFCLSLNCVSNAAWMPCLCHSSHRSWLCCKTSLAFLAVLAFADSPVGEIVRWKNAEDTHL